uniref:Angiopoietin like 8 n=1 Tax=Denticeps clupeoides TaxID=299321 RepID=A0AAY4CH55_9TELE
MTSVTFCALCALLWTSGAAPVPTAPASEEEVNVLMFGVLQFGDSMRHMYQSIETKLDRIRRNILNTQGLVERLGQETQEAQQAEAQIREGLNHIQVRGTTAGLWAETQQVRGLVNKAEQEEQRLKRKLRSLENKLRAASPDNIKTLKVGFIISHLSHITLVN